VVFAYNQGNVGNFNKVVYRVHCTATFLWPACSILLSLCYTSRPDGPWGRLV